MSAADQNVTLAAASAEQIVAELRARPITDAHTTDILMAEWKRRTNFASENLEHNRAASRQQGHREGYAEGLQVGVRRVRARIRRQRIRRGLLGGGIVVVGTVGAKLLGRL